MQPNSKMKWMLLSAAAMLALGACGKPVEDKEAQAREAAYKEKYAKAKALFEERCKTAGVVVKRTVKDVEGIELAKIRQPIPWGGKEYFDPMYPEAAMAREHRGDDYIKQFLMSEFVNPADSGRRGALGPPAAEELFKHFPAKRGYSFVEYVDSTNGQRFRCTPDWSRQHPNWVDGQHHCKPVDRTATRYALDYEDLVEPADRALWVAGTRLKVVDKQTGNVLAELTRYVWDPGFGASTTGRWPWQHANSGGGDQMCPHQAGEKADVSRKFIDEVIKAKQGE
ncbi:hypothetical protein [Pelomonas sp. BJYL3]|uniref:hypothetical protein n=1 Tax=Pelomonas sp. BJYL3 TaxID=2976697 RepID=UPI0022B47624|nr:hypothetical protein [Pelomonas sp. BJYL3]